MTSVLIISPYPMVRAGLAALLATAGGGLVIAGEGESAASWALTGAATVSVVIYDVDLETGEEATGVRRVRHELPQAAVLAVIDAGQERRMVAALQAGARGVILRTATSRDLVEAVAEVAEGGLVLPPGSTSALVDQLRGDIAGTVVLSPRELEVLRGVAAGQTNKAIALKLGISEHTVKFHLGSAMTKLGAVSRAEALASAIRQGLLSV
jgi:DNA-binding NarL/FixJ family response regulator